MWFLSLLGKLFCLWDKIKKGNKFLDNIGKESIVPFYNKLNIFIGALQENKKINIEKLYEDAIALYEKNNLVFKKYKDLINVLYKE